jgi:3-methyladenine DNA glycosylase AlkC
MEDLEKLIQRVEKTEHGFISILKEAENIKNSNNVKDCLIISKKLFLSKIPQARMLSTFILGYIAYESTEALNFLRESVSKDKDWRVQEILAKSFDRFCLDTGYENAMPSIEDWLSDQNPNVRRAVSEGLRIWTGREYFKEHPDIAIKLLSALKADDSEYVRKSVGNALRDISKKHRDLIKSEIDNWDLTNTKIKQTYLLAGKFLTK